MLLCILAEGEKSVTELEQFLGERQSTVSRSNSRGYDSIGLVTTRRDGKAIYYSLANEDVRKILDRVYDVFCEPVRRARCAGIPALDFRPPGADYPKTNKRKREECSVLSHGVCCGLPPALCLVLPVARDVSARLRCWRTPSSVGLSPAESFALAASVALLLTQSMAALAHRPFRSIYLSASIGLGGAIIGGLMFGIGMALVGTCGFGTLVRVGGGDLRAIVAFSCSAFPRSHHAWITGFCGLH